MAKSVLYVLKERSERGELVKEKDARKLNLPSDKQTTEQPNRARDDERRVSKCKAYA